MRACLLPILAALAALALAPAAGAEAAALPGSMLFVQQAGGGALLRGDGGGFRLRLTEVSPAVSTFTDRPERRAGRRSLRRFVGSWGRYGFAAEAPNAALVLDRAPAAGDVAMLTLSDPRYDRRRRTLSYRAVPLRSAVGSDLAGFERRRDPVRARRFGGAALFIDGGEAGTVSAPFSLQLSGVGELETLNLVSTAGSAEVRFEDLKLSNKSELPITRLAGAGSDEVVVETGIAPAAAAACPQYAYRPTACDPPPRGFGGSFSFQLSGTYTVAGLGTGSVEALLSPRNINWKVVAEVGPIGPFDLADFVGPEVAPGVGPAGLSFVVGPGGITPARTGPPPPVSFP